MAPFHSEDQKTLRRPDHSTGRARGSFVLAIIALAVGVVCIMGGHWGPGLILVFAAVAGVMTAWQLRTCMKQRSTETDDHAA